MRTGTTIGLGLALVASGLLTLPAEAQTPAPANVKIERRGGTGCAGPAPSCGLYLVNMSKTDRAVATVVTTVAGELVHFQDFGRNSFPLRTPVTQIVLLFPGQEFRLSEGIDLHGNGADIRPLSYAVAGSYTPRPDLMDLPHERAQDWVRLRAMNYTPYPDGACPLGKAFLLTVRNLNLFRSVALTYRNTTPGRNPGPQTLYLAPGTDAPIGCDNEWKNIELIGAAFTG